MTKTALYALGFFLAGLYLSGCKYENEHAWDVNLLAPIAQGELTMKDLVKDSSLHENNDRSLNIVNVVTLKEIGIGDLVNIPDTTVPPTGVSLKKLELGERTMTRNISLGEIAKNAGPVGFFIIASNGDSMVVPPISNMSSGDVDVNATSFFESATFISGKMKITMTNNLPVEVRNVMFEFRNKGNKAIIIQDTVNSLMPKGVFQRVYPLDEKTVEGHMVAKILKLSSPGSNGDSVLIDTSDALEVVISAYDMQVREAVAVFPAQNLINNWSDDIYNMHGPEIKYMLVRKGMINIKADHTIREKLHLRYYIPEARKNGRSLDINSTLAASPNGSNVSRNDSFPIDGYAVDFAGSTRNLTNAFYRLLQVRIDSTGELKQLSLDDSIYMSYGLYNIIPEYARGYLGQQTILVNSISDFDFMGGVTDGKLRLEDLAVNLELSNGVGAPGQVIIKSLRALNSRTNKYVDLTSTILNEPQNISPATDNPLTPSITKIKLDAGNSNIASLLSIVPDKIGYDLEFRVNPAGNTKEYKDFIYYDSKVKANLIIEAPLQVGLEGLTLQDTTTVDIGGIAQLDNIQDGKLNLTVENTFPVDAAFQVFITDHNGKLLDSLLTPNSIIQAGVASPPQYRVSKPTISTIQIKVTPSVIEKLKNTDNKLIMRTKLDTKPLNQNVKIYTDYRIRAKLTADLRYRTTF
jgi:hypothetical protein